MAIITGTGVLTSDAAVVSGAGDVSHVGSGALASGAALTGKTGLRNGDVSHVGSGALTSGAAVLVGLPYISASGAISSASAMVSGVGVVGHTGTGVLASSVAAITGAGGVSDTGSLISDPATITGSGLVYRIEGFGTLASDLASINATALLYTRSQLVSGLAVIAGAGDVGHVGTGALVQQPVVLSGTGARQYNFVSTLVVTAVLSHEMRVESGPNASLESYYEATGYRKSVPTLVYVLEATQPSQVDTEVPANRSFLVSGAFNGGPGDAFYEQGAGAFYIGTRVVEGALSILSFRTPIENEVIWYVPTSTLYRYELNRDTGSYFWNVYRSMPERALGGLLAIETFDPDKVFAYYARVMGAMSWRWNYDNAVLRDQFDPERCASANLAALASQWGLALTFDDTLAVRRAKTRSAVPAFKLKGTNDAVELRLRTMGFLGYATELWVDPDDVGNYPSAVINKAGLSSSGVLGSGTDVREYPHAYISTEPTDYWLSSRIAIHINNFDGSPIDFGSYSTLELQALFDRVFRELRYEILPAHVDIRWFGTDVDVTSSTPEGLEVGETFGWEFVESVGLGGLTSGLAVMSGSGTVT